MLQSDSVQSGPTLREAIKCDCPRAAGLKRLDAFLQEHDVKRVGFEASGGYEWRLMVHLRGKKVSTNLGAIQTF
ncbi:hypothetical protein [Rhizobium metallidurans]|uniref:Uncharacterized protein n=1 Tax=Rhizobium metallidurans TaxID=1265931 RepID=A0A7W6CXQ2_9HYPH|nr:hypothetical protein [Rhizobium metallidurans]MBB3967008.1 hypothetical protein [Rhizobium metallidurans]